MNAIWRINQVWICNVSLEPAAPSWNWKWLMTDLIKYLNFITLWWPFRKNHLIPLTNRTILLFRRTRLILCIGNLISLSCSRSSTFSINFFDQIRNSIEQIQRSTSPQGPSINRSTSARQFWLIWISIWVKDLSKKSTMFWIANFWLNKWPLRRHWPFANNFELNKCNDAVEEILIIYIFNDI